MTDLTLFGEAPPVIEQPACDVVADALVAKGFVPNTFILDLNKGLTVPHDMKLPNPWNLPSRLFRFPIEVTDQEENWRTQDRRAASVAERPPICEARRSDNGYRGGPRRRAE